MKFLIEPKSLDILDNPNATVDQIRSIFLDVCVYETNLDIYKRFLQKTSFNFMMNNETPLTVAVVHNTLKVIKFLIECGADLMITDGTKTLPYDYAVIGDRKDVEEFLFYLTLVEMTKVKDQDIETINKNKQDLMEKRKAHLRGNIEEK